MPCGSALVHSAEIEDFMARIATDVTSLSDYWYDHWYDMISVKGIHMVSRKNTRKAKRTFSLSPDIVSYLESERKATRQRSLSAVLEELVRQYQQAREMERVSASVTRYYDSLTPDEVAEERAWGEFATAQFPDEA